MKKIGYTMGVILLIYIGVLLGENLLFSDYIGDNNSGIIEIEPHTLSYHIVYDHRMTVRTLLLLGSDVNELHEGWDGGVSPLMVAATLSEKNPDERARLCDTLIKHGADVNLRNRNGESVLAYAVERADYDAVKYLVEKGAVVNQCFDFTDDLYPEIYNISILELAVLQDCYDISKYLLEHGADANYRNEMGMTPVMMSFLYLDESIVYDEVYDEKMNILICLMEQGADITIEDNKGKTALDYADELIALAQKNVKQDDGEIVLERWTKMKKVLQGQN